MASNKFFVSNSISFILYKPEIEKINGSMAPENSGAHRPHHYSLASYSPVVGQQCTIGNATSEKMGRAVAKGGRGCGVRMLLTSILSESMMVLRRWAMVSTVQSMNCSLRASWMMPSVLGTHQPYNKL